MRSSNKIPRRSRRLKADWQEEWRPVRKTGMRAAVGKEHAFQNCMCGQADLNRATGRIVHKYSFARLEKEKELEAIHQTCSKALVNASLSRKLSVKIYGGLKRIVGCGDVVRQKRGGKLCFAPIMIVKGVCQFLAVKADLPGKDAIFVERAAIEFRNCILVIAR